MGVVRAWVPALILLSCAAWALVAWMTPHDYAAGMLPSVLWHRIASVALLTLVCIHAFLAASFDGPWSGVGGVRR